MRLGQLGQTLMLITVLGGTLEAQIPDFTPPTPLIAALMHNDTEEAKNLLAKGADPNEGRLLVFSPVFLSVIYQNKAIFDAIAAKGVDLQERDPSGATLLMWAAYNDKGNTEIVEELLRRGLDPNATNKAGETALTWASRRGSTAVVAILERAGASNQAVIKDAAQRSIALLQKSGTQFVRISACVSCHHTFLPQMAAELARSRGLSVDEKIVNMETAATIGMVKPMRDELLRNPNKMPDPPVTLSYGLLSVAANHYPADETTDAMAQVIAKWQRPDGGFQAMPMRPPIEGSHFAATALSLRAMQLYGKGSEERVRRAADWLRKAKPSTAEDAAMRLLGMSWAGAPAEELKAAVRSLLDEQRPDGGWAQLPGLETDAYATGQALVALKWSGQVSASDAAYQRGLGFLLRTQFADGSWLVRSRSFPVQPYKESGFPFGKDQWISAMGTSWATMALTLALPEPPVAVTASVR
jgi:hypothetical protein